MCRCQVWLVERNVLVGVRDGKRRLDVGVMGENRSAVAWVVMISSVNRILSNPIQVGSFKGSAMSEISYLLVGGGVHIYLSVESTRATIFYLCAS